MRWLWLEKMDPSRPWSTLPIQIPIKAQAFFSVAKQTEVGNGANTLFWKDRWINRQWVADIAPKLLATIPKRRVNKCTVQEALSGHNWVSDIGGALTIGVLVEYLHLWNILYKTELQPEKEDIHFWRFATNGKFSVKSAYEGFFKGSGEFEPYERTW
jgi:uncharacterized protein YegJ (DUF2314 family)